MKHAEQKHARRCAKLFGGEIHACPTCLSYKLSYFLPLRTEATNLEDASEIVKMFIAGGPGVELAGFLKIICRGCGFQGPSVDVQGKTYEDVTCNPDLTTAVREAWNAVERCKTCRKSSCSCIISFSA